MKIYPNIVSTIGRTPLVELTNLEKQYKLQARLIAKVERFNPAGSVKDRIAKAMIEGAIRKGLIKKGTTIIEPTSGNTGIGLAMVAASYGLKIILTMPETMSKERQTLLKAYGANLVLTDGKLGMKGAIKKAEELAKETPNSFVPMQFENMANPAIHYLTTGREIYEDTEGEVDIFVAGVGTGGTLSGVSQFLKEKKPSVLSYAVEPDSSPVISEGKAGPHKIQGIGAGFLPKTLDTSAFDFVVRITNEEAFEMTKEVARKEGLLVGISSGAALRAAIQIASKKENKGKMVVVLLPDTGERYLSTGVFED